VATPEFDVDQVALVVRVWVLLSSSVPVAANCSVVPSAMLYVGAVTAIETRGEDVSVTVPETPM